MMHELEKIGLFKINRKEKWEVGFHCPFRHLFNIKFRGADKEELNGSS